MCRKYTIGVLIGNANSPYATDLMEGIIATAEKLKVNLLFYLGIHSDSAYRASFGNQEKDDFEYQFNVVYDYIELSKVDALIVSYGTVGHYLGGMSKEDFLKMFAGIPYVLVEEADTSGNGSSVTTDNYAGMYELVEHLITEHHCKNLVMVSGPKGQSDADERRYAFIDVMKKYQLPFDDSYITYGDYSAHVESNVEALFDTHPEADACVCGNDLMADCVYRYLQKKGMKVGVDIAVTGYDDWDNAAYMIPPLTTVLQDPHEMGDMAVHAALELSEGMKPKDFHVPARVIYRASCGCRKHKLEEIQVNKEELYWMDQRSADAERFIVMSKYVKAAHDQFDTYRQETWFLPLISREMMNHVDDEEEFFRVAMARMAAFRIHKSYLLMLETPVIHSEGDTWVSPEKMYLVASQENGVVTSYPLLERPVISKENGISKLVQRENQFCMQIFILFSGETQYGILVTEITPDDLALSYLASMQISNALRFLELSHEQERTRRKLEKLLTEINEKNEVLNFISENDAMTNCLNRRGFMEAVMQMNKQYIGKKAALLFADVDHLKEINDSYGHMEGDFAICRIASVLTKAVKDAGVVGRIGGDEFAAMVLEEKGDIESISALVKEQNHYFNESDEKEYYIEASVGIQHFVCSEDISIAELLDAADVELYRNKKTRRKTVKKD